MPPERRLAILIMSTNAENPSGAGLDIRVGRDRASATISLFGELDISGADSVQAIASVLLGRRAVDVDVDVRDLTFCDAAGLSVLLGIRDKVQQSGRRMRLLAVPDCVARLLQVLSMEHAFNDAHSHLRST